MIIRGFWDSAQWTNYTPRALKWDETRRGVKEQYPPSLVRIAKYLQIAKKRFVHISDGGS